MCCITCWLYGFSPILTRNFTLGKQFHECVNAKLQYATSNDIELNMKHITIAATVNDYYSKKYYLCITSANCTNNNASQVLKKMRQLIYCLHYLGQDSMCIIAWLKTPPNQRAEDWASRMLAKRLSLQDLVV